MCVFCKIINGEIPSKKVYEDDDVLAILDLSQATMGHTLVMPKKHFDTILDADSKTVEKVFAVVQKLAKKITKNLNATGVNILCNTNPVAGQTVMHMHVHIIPRYNESDLTIKFTNNEGKYDMDEILKKING